MKPLVSVLILNYRNAKAAVDLVQNLLQQTAIDDMEILVINNHSEDDSIGILRNRLGDYKNVSIIETPKNAGFGYGYNVGASYARGEYLLINNPDKVLPKDGVGQLLHKMQSNNDIGVLAPKLVHPDGTRRLSMRTFPRLIDILSRRSFIRAICPGCLRRYLMLDADPNKETEVDWVVGGCFMIPADVFKKIEGFDERFFLFFEDTDLCKRVRLLGKSVVYYPSVEAKDKRNRLSGESFFDLLFKKTGRIHVVSAIKYFWKWGFLS